MKTSKYSSKIPYARFIRSGKQFCGNDAFTKEFGDPILQEKLKLILEKRDYFDGDSPYEVELFWIDEKEYIAILSPLEENKVLSIYIYDTTAFNSIARSLKPSREFEQEFFNILESMHDDFVIINNKGIIEKVLPNFAEMYGISAEEAVGKSVFEMEERKIFNPSIAARVMKSLKRETLLQLTGAGKYLMCTAIPVFDKEGQLDKIVSYTRDMTKYEVLKEEYNNLQETLALYTEQLGQLRQEHIKSAKIIGNSTAIKKLLNTIERIAKFDANVLLTGESGVGKTLFAEAIHSVSMRKGEPFITINCGAIPENLLESELFGYEKGAFTGAGQDGKPGLIELSHKGTLFLDEIGDLPLHMQVKLLKVIQDKKVIRVGGVKEKQVDFRLIAATNKDIKKMIEENRFREDLFYRLNVISINIPPLRERKEDIFFLITHFLNKFNELYKVNHIFSNRAIDYLEEYFWPGNTRELENVIERMVITTEDYVINEEMLPQNIYTKKPEDNYDFEGTTLKEILENVERRVLTQCYKEHKTTTKVAQVLGISQPSVSLKLNKYLKGKQDADDIQ